MTPLSVPCKCTLKRSSSIVLSNWKFTWVRRLSLCPCQLIFVTHFHSACRSFHFHHWAKEMWSQQVLRMNCSAALFFFLLSFNLSFWVIRKPLNLKTHFRSNIKFYVTMFCEIRHGRCHWITEMMADLIQSVQC